MRVNADLPPNQVFLMCPYVPNVVYYHVFMWFVVLPRMNERVIGRKGRIFIRFVEMTGWR